MSYLAKNIRFRFFGCTLEASGAGYRVRQPIPYLGRTLDFERRDEGVTYYRRRSSFIATSITKDSGGSLVVNGGTLADIASGMTLTNGFGSTVSAADGALSSALVEEQNGVFSFYVPDPITVQVLTDAYLGPDGSPITTSMAVTFIPYLWTLYRTGSSSPNYRYYYEPTSPVLNTIPTVDTARGDVFGVHNVDSFIGGALVDAPNYYTAAVIPFPSGRATAPSGSARNIETIYGYGPQNINQPVVWSTTAADVAGWLQLFQYPNRPVWGGIYHAETVYS